MGHITRTGTIGRRGILAIGAAVAAGIAAKEAALPVAAATVTNSNFVANGTGTSFLTQGLFQDGVVSVGSNTGVSGSGTNIGVSGPSGSGHGVFGTTFGGVFSTSVTGKTGVTGVASGTGNFGVLGIGGVGDVTIADNTVGVWGNYQSTGAGPIGVFGSATNGIGVFGTTSAAGQFGVVGQTLVDNAFGLAGIANTNGSAAFAGATTNPSSFAASFQGHVIVAGAFDVFPMVNKHDLAQHPDGSVRTFCSVESPECWVEDFGEGTLAAGKADIKLDADFAALVPTDKYHVFLAEHGGHHGLHTTTKAARSFTVEADADLTAVKGKKTSDLTGIFSWRVVAKPKTDANVERLAKGRLAPKIDAAKLPKQPKAPPAIVPPKPLPAPTMTPSTGSPAG